MTTSHEVISALVDDEPFDADDLARALADPEGRELLIDLVALRQVVEASDPSRMAPALRPRRRERPLWLAAVAAAVLLIASGGFVAGLRVAHAGDARMATSRSASDAAPAPTRVIDLKPGVNWHETKGGQ